MCLLFYAVISNIPAMSRLIVNNRVWIRQISDWKIEQQSDAIGKRWHATSPTSQTLTDDHSVPFCCLLRKAIVNKFKLNIYSFLYESRKTHRYWHTRCVLYRRRRPRENVLQNNLIPSVRSLRKLESQTSILIQRWFVGRFRYYYHQLVPLVIYITYPTCIQRVSRCIASSRSKLFLNWISIFENN